MIMQELTVAVIFMPQHLKATPPPHGGKELENIYRGYSGELFGSFLIY
jgi:hypothetical protein